jgi:hypothetical protein
MDKSAIRSDFSLTAAKGKDDIGGSGQKLRAMNYKDHHIEVSVRAVVDPNGWRPDIFVSYSEHGKNVLKSVPMDQSFATPDEATQGGVEYAKKWIDDGKPDLEKLKKE